MGVHLRYQQQHPGEGLLGPTPPYTAAAVVAATLHLRPCAPGERLQGGAQLRWRLQQGSCVEAGQQSHEGALQVALQDVLEVGVPPVQQPVVPGGGF